MSMRDFLKLSDSEMLGMVLFYMIQVDTGPVLHRLEESGFEFHKDAAHHTFMRMNGKPWKQPLHRRDDFVVIEISRFGPVNMLATANHPSKGVNDPLTLVLP